jgi:hypothetical protein
MGACASTSVGFSCCKIEPQAVVKSLANWKKFLIFGTNIIFVGIILSVFWAHLPDADKRGILSWQKHIDRGKYSAPITEVSTVSIYTSVPVKKITNLFTLVPRESVLLLGVSMKIENCH